MREYLFRGKIIGSLPELDGNWISGDLLSSGSLAKVIATKYGSEYLVDRETVGQFTGLTDKNGVKIFEGDIIEITIEISDDPYLEYKVKTGKIEYESGNFWFMGSGYSINDWFQYNSSDIKVIGNIHDNPELLEVKNAGD